MFIWSRLACEHMKVSSWISSKMSIKCCLQQTNHKNLMKNKLSSSINLTKWCHQGMQQVAFKIMSNSLTHLHARIHKPHNTILFFLNEIKCKAILYRKHNLKCMRVVRIWYFVNIIVLSENNGRTSNVTRKSKGKCKVVEPNYIEIKTRKPKQANWENAKMFAFISVKKVEHKANLNIIDSKDNMEIEITKWKCISKVVLTNGHSAHHHNEVAYMDKWGFCMEITKQSMIGWMLLATIRTIERCLQKTRPHKDWTKKLQQIILWVHWCIHE